MVAGRSCRGSQQGFTLLEILVAFMVFALSFAFMLELLGQSLKNTRVANDYTLAALHARSVMDRVGLDIELEEGVEEGELDERFRYRLEIRKTEFAAGPVSESAYAPVDIFAVELKIQFGERETRFSTIKLAQPEFRGLGQ